MLAAEAAGTDGTDGAGVSGVDPGEDLPGPPVKKGGGQGGADGGLPVAVAPEGFLADDVHDLIGAGRGGEGFQLHKADGGAVRGTDHEKPVPLVELERQHGRRYRDKDPPQGLDHVRLLMEIPGDLGIAHPPDEGLYVLGIDFRTQKNRSGFLHIAYLTVKILKSPSMHTASTVLLYEITISIPEQAGNVKPRDGFMLQRGNLRGNPAANS